MSRARRGAGPAWMGMTLAVSAGVLLLSTRGLAQRGGQETVRIELPPSVTFYLTNLAIPTEAFEPTVIRFDQVSVRPGRVLAISVRAEDRRFAAPFGPQIPIDLVTWRASNAVNGQGFNGSLSRNWEEVFEGFATPAPGGVTLRWTMAPPPPGLASGVHTVLVRWRLRVVNP